MKSTVVALAILLVAAVLPGSDSFTAGAGNIGMSGDYGKRTLQSQVG